MLTIIQSILLGIVQGITEWLPVSSSGHLVLLQNFLSINVPVVYDIMLHIGTLIPVIFIFRKEIMDLVKSFFKMKFHDIGLILVASVVTAIICFSFLKFFESLFSSTTAVGVGLIVTGIFLLASKFFHGNRKISFADAVIIGIAQGLAIVPGISRSGTTISVGLMRKIDKKTIFTFSFILSIIAVIGAQAVEMKNFSLADISITSLLAGIAAAAVVGYIAIKILAKMLVSEKFHLFAYYCFAAGLAVLLFL